MRVDWLKQLGRTGDCALRAGRQGFDKRRQRGRLFSHHAGGAQWRKKCKPAPRGIWEDRLTMRRRFRVTGAGQATVSADDALLAFAADGGTLLAASRVEVLGEGGATARCVATGAYSNPEALVAWWRLCLAPGARGCALRATDWAQRRRQTPRGVGARSAAEIRRRRATLCRWTARLRQRAPVDTAEALEWAKRAGWRAVHPPGRLAGGVDRPRCVATGAWREVQR